jgi:flavodoxin
MILYSFLEAHDLSGKNVIPFNTHGGSGFSNTIGVIAKLQPGAAVLGNGLTIHRDDVQDAEPSIVVWLKTLGF